MYDQAQLMLCHCIGGVIPGCGVIFDNSSDGYSCKHAAVCWKYYALFNKLVHSLKKLIGALFLQRIIAIFLNVYFEISNICKEAKIRSLSLLLKNHYSAAGFPPPEARKSPKKIKTISLLLFGAGFAKSSDIFRRII